MNTDFQKHLMIKIEILDQESFLVNMPFLRKTCRLVYIMDQETVLFIFVISGITIGKRVISLFDNYIEVVSKLNKEVCY